MARIYPDVRTIVELGCGDWSTTNKISLGEREYVGIDIVKAVIDQNENRFGSDRIKFLHSDFVDQAPPGRSIACKGCPATSFNASVVKFIQSSLKSYRYAIFTNDIRKTEYRSIVFGIRFPRRFDVCNRDIRDGESRSISVRNPPFNLSVSECACYKVILRKFRDELST